VLPAGSAVRYLDALYLATALSFLELYSNLTVLSFDARIRDNLRALGVPDSGGR